MGRALGRVLAEQAGRMVVQRIVPAVRALAPLQDVRADTIEDDDIDRLTDVVEQSTIEHVQGAEGEVASIARRHTAEVSRRHREDLRRQISVAIEARPEIEIDVTAGEPWLGEVVEERVAATLGMMEWATEGLYRQVARELSRDLLAGVRVDEIAARLEREYGDQTGDGIGIGRRRALFIARNELGNLNAALSERRHRDLGITHYVWRTSGDERVRGPGGKYPNAFPSHRAREGQRFAWADPPSQGRNDGHPGQPYGCRCHSEPVFDDDDEADAPSAEPERPAMPAPPRRKARPSKRKQTKKKKPRRKAKPTLLPNRTYDKDGRDPRTLEERRVVVDVTRSPAAPRRPWSKAKPSDWADLIGAPDGARVDVSETSSGEVYLSGRLRDPEGRIVWEATRTVRPDGILQHDFQEVNEDGPQKGRGTLIFGQQARTARRLGFNEIRANAAGDKDHPKYNGYWTWPRMGFDRPLTPAEIERYGATTMLDLFRTQKGRDMWREEGAMHDVVFDLREGSESMRALEAYEKERWDRGDI